MKADGQLEGTSDACRANDNRAAEHIDDSGEAPPIAQGKISYLFKRMRRVLSSCNLG